MFAFSRMTVFEYAPGPGQKISTIPYLTSIPTEVRFGILKLLLPDIERVPCRFNSSDVRPPDTTIAATVDSDDSENDIWPQLPPPPPPPHRTAPANTGGSYISLRQDGQSCHAAIMRTCRQVYDECISIIYAPTRTFEATITYRSGPKIYLLYKLPFSLQPNKENKIATKKSAALIKALRRINSLKITLPPYERQNWCQPLANAVQNFICAMREHFHDGCPFTKLTVDMMSDQVAYLTVRPQLPYGSCRMPPRSYPPGPPPQPMPGSVLAPPSMIFPLYDPKPLGSVQPTGQIVVDQAYLKWTIAAFHDLFGLEDGSVQFLVSGRSIAEINDPPLPILSEFVTRLTSSMCCDKAGCAPWKLPTNFEHLPRLMVCADPLRGVNARILHSEPASPNNLQPPPAPTIPNVKHGSPELWLWDCWDRGAWDDIQEEYDQIKCQWKELWQVAHMSFEGLDAAIALSKVQGTT